MATSKFEKMLEKELKKEGVEIYRKPTPSPLRFNDRVEISEEGMKLYLKSLAEKEKGKK